MDQAWYQINSLVVLTLYRTIKLRYLWKFQNENILGFQDKESDDTKRNTIKLWTTE